MTDRRRTFAPLLFVLVALLGLVLVPLWGEAYVRPLHEQMRGVAEPGRGMITRIHVALALEASLLRDFLQTGDSAFLRRYRDVEADEQAAYRALAPLAAQLGPDARARFADVERLQREWHALVDRALATPGAPPVDPLHADGYEALLLAAARLDEEIGDEAQLRRARILAAERRVRTVSVALGMVALVAAAVVARLGVRLRRYAREAEAARSALERANEMRARLMRGISHDLKNPLNAIDGHAQLLEEEIKGPLNGGQRDSIARIRRAVRSLLGLVGDLVELSRVEAGHLRIAPVPTDIAQVVRESGEEHRAAAETAGHRLEVALDGGAEPVVTDPERVRQVLGNLLSNAVKYTPPPGRIEVRLARRAPPNRGGEAWVAVDVADSGGGVPERMRESIFDEFTRLEEHEHKAGAGLGLAIARRITRLLGGDITVDDTPGGGATFTLWLPPDRRRH